MADVPRFLPPPDGYRPNYLFDEICREFKLKSKKELAEFLQLSVTKVIAIANHRAPLGAIHVLHIHEATTWSVAYIRDLAGDKSELFYRPPKDFKWQD